jgi:hypothetical protein
MTHLWEIDHPYYGPEGYANETDSFAELRADVDASDDHMNHVYRWDWIDYTQPYADTLFLDGEDRSEQKFVVYLVMPRKSAFWSISCPVTHEQEPEILEWLRGPRVLGALRTLWQPLLDEQAGGAL